MRKVSIKKRCFSFLLLFLFIGCLSLPSVVLPPQNLIIARFDGSLKVRWESVGGKLICSLAFYPIVGWFSLGFPCSFFLHSIALKKIEEEKQLCYIIFTHDLLLSILA